MDTPEEKAKEIYQIYYDLLISKINDDANLHELTKEVAINMVDVILDSSFPNFGWGDYWIEVKSNIKWL